MAHLLAAMHAIGTGGASDLLTLHSLLPSTRSLMLKGSTRGKARGRTPMMTVMRTETTSCLCLPLALRVLLPTLTPLMPHCWQPPAARLTTISTPSG